ncbi:hypothetical protein, conserved [Eimeria brunetti]|uniref:Transmembrane protein n=1 Tax=Eimeria brunetti TaxID=51314 RepID=U6LV49_9EIME|nr:hypothetical protein, conserved [Eimeria brunetti]
MLPAAALDGPGDQREGESLKLSPLHLKNEFIFKGEFPATASPEAVQGSGGPVVPPDELGRPRHTRTRKRSLLVSMAASMPLLALLMILSLCRAAHLRDRSRGATPRRLSERTGEGTDDSEQSVLDECLALEEDLGISHAGEPSSSQDGGPGGFDDLVSSLLRAAAAGQSAHQVQSAHGGEASSSPTPTGSSQMPPSEMSRGEQSEQRLQESEHAGGTYFDLDSSSTSGGGGGFWGRIPALDPDAWLETIPDINESQGQQEQQISDGSSPSGSGSGDSFDMTRFAISPSPPTSPAGEHGSAGEGEHSSSRRSGWLPIMSPSPEREHGWAAYPSSTASLPAPHGGSGFGDRSPGVGVNAWLEGIYDITGGQRQQEQQVQQGPSYSGSGSGILMDGERRFAGLPSAVHAPDQQHISASEGAHGEGDPFVQLPVPSRGDQRVVVLEHGRGPHSYAHSFGEDTGRRAFLDPDAWLEGISDISGGQGQQEQWSQGASSSPDSGSGESRGGGGSTTASASSHYSPGEKYSSAGEGYSSSGHSFMRLLGLSPREQGFLERRFGEAAHSPSTSSGDGDVGGGQPALDPDAWLEGIADITEVQRQQQQRKQTESSSSESSGESRGGDGSTTLTASSPHTSEEERERAREDEEFKSHPFVRLPVLEEGLVVREFDVTVLSGERRKYWPVVCILKTIRRLFLQPTLGQSDVNTLMTALEDLVYSSLANVKKNKLHPTSSLFLPSLGKYFIAFDYLVSARQILGPYLRAEEWWESFISCFDLDFPMYKYIPVNKHSRHTTAVRKILANRLLEVMQIYRRGRRPPLRTVIELKRLLLCSPYTHKRFLEGKWDEWREDEEEPFARGHRPK